MSRGGDDRILVVVSGHPGAGKSTFAPRLAAELDAVCISRDLIANEIFDAWEPTYPEFASGGDVQVEGWTFRQGQANWSVFTTMIEQVLDRISVVADTPFNHEWGRRRFRDMCARCAVPAVEVALEADLDRLLRRVEARAADPASHAIKRFHTVPGARRLLVSSYVPTLPDEQVVRVDTNDFSRLDPGAVAAEVRARAALVSLGPSRPVEPDNRDRASRAPLQGSSERRS